MVRTGLGAVCPSPHKEVDLIATAQFSGHFDELPKDVLQILNEGLAAWEVQFWEMASEGVEAKLKETGERLQGQVKSSLDERPTGEWALPVLRLSLAARELAGSIAKIQAIEHAGDELGEQVIERLERAFITPMDRGDIHELARRMDDVLDRIQEIAETLQIYDITAPTEEARRLSAILSEQTTEILAALRKLESMKGLDASLKRVHEL